MVHLIPFGARAWRKLHCTATAGFRARCHGVMKARLGEVGCYDAEVVVAVTYLKGNRILMEFGYAFGGCTFGVATPTVENVASLRNRGQSHIINKPIRLRHWIDDTSAGFWRVADDRQLVLAVWSLCVNFGRSYHRKHKDDRC